MPRFKGRPAEPITIADCSSIWFPKNPALQCPHGLFWWESDGDKLTDDLQRQMCREPGCEATEYHPHEGESITLRDIRTFNGRKPVRALYNEAFAIGNGAPVPEGFEDRLRDIIQHWVVDWTWTGLDGQVLPLPVEDWEAVGDNLEYAEMLWIVEAAMLGRDPREQLYRPLAVASGKDSPSG